MQKRSSAVLSSPSPIQPDRDVDCLVALVPAFRGLVQTAEDAGWTAQEIAASLLALTHVYDKELPERELCH
jgi:hypothetical protein